MFFELMRVIAHWEQSCYKEVAQKSNLLTMQADSLQKLKEITIKREVLAILWALNKFIAYGDGQGVTVASDHHPLRW